MGGMRPGDDHGIGAPLTGATPPPIHAPSDTSSSVTPGAHSRDDLLLINTLRLLRLIGRMLPTQRENPAIKAEVGGRQSLRVQTAEGD